MAQITFVAGEVLTAANANTYMTHEGNAWTTYTPTLTQSATPTKTVSYASYARAGRMIFGNVLLSVTSAGTAANTVLVGLPVAAAAALVANTPVGNLAIYDSSVTTWYHGIALINSASVVYGAASGATAGLGAATFTAALASGDLVLIHFHYESAA